MNANTPPEPDQHQVMAGRLREAREAIGLTQADTAGVLGIGRSSVVAMEKGTRKVTGLELRRMARLYRRSVSWLLGEDEPTLPEGTEALFRATEELSDLDREQVLRFAQFLAAQPANKDARQPRPPRGPDQP